jgi:hypothetical protein
MRDLYRRNPNKNLGNPNKKKEKKIRENVDLSPKAFKIGEIQPTQKQKNTFLFGFRQISPDFGRI